MAVATWRHRPGARELLDARLARGWAPAATPTQKGEKVLGFAACIFERKEDETVRDAPAGT